LKRKEIVILEVKSDMAHRPPSAQGQTGLHLSILSGSVGNTSAVFVIAR